MKKITCAICGENEKITVLYKENFDSLSVDEKIFSARRIPDHCHYLLVKCQKCGLIFSRNVLPSDKISKLYKESKLTYDTEIPYLQKTYGSYLKRIEEYFPSKTNLLEIGCGNGFFLEEAKRQGFKNVYGVEPSVEAVKKALPSIEKNIIVDIFKAGLFKNDFFDVICCFQTLDHIVDPNSFLQNCHRILKKGGVLFCITHNTDALSAKIMREKSPIFDIEHIYLFNKKTIFKIMEINGFKVLSEFDVKNIYPLRYWARMMPLSKSIKNKLLVFLEKSHLDKQNLTLNPGNMGIVAGK